MITLNFTVNTTVLNVLRDKIKNVAPHAEHLVALKVREDTRPFVPYGETGNLDSSTKVEDNAVIYPGPMSRYLYYGKLMVDPNTGSAWAKKGVKKVKALPEKDLVFNTSVHADAQAFWFEASKAQNIEDWVRVAGKAVTKLDR